ncbi:MAG: hypothetical protein LBI55_04265 [Oscillospiraceae bacterium]|nr:hypothetical protein [Oscillospiraceae bacterium]
MKDKSRKKGKIKNLDNNNILSVSGGINSNNVSSAPNLLKAEDFSPPVVSGIIDTNGTKWRAILLNSKWVWYPDVPDDIVSGLLVENYERTEYPQELWGWPDEYEVGDDVDSE